MLFQWMWNELVVCEMILWYSDVINDKIGFSMLRYYHMLDERICLQINFNEW